MIRLCTWADEKMTQSMVRCEISAREHGIDNVWYLEKRKRLPEDIFHSMNREILNAERGAGYWLYKPFVIMDTILHMQDGDILVYADAGVEFVNHVSHIIDRMDEDIFFFTNGFPHVEWCKADVLESILPTYGGSRLSIRSDRNWLSNEYKQVQASVIFFRVNQKTRDFVKEWLLYCQMPGFIDDSPSKTSNYPTFAEHRHDQAILTCLQIKYGYKLHFWPTIYSEHIRHTALPEDSYPTMFNHHRRRNHGMGNGDAEWPNP